MWVALGNVSGTPTIVIAYQNASAPTTAIMMQIMTAVMTRINSLNLIAASSVQIKMSARALENLEASPPLILIAPYNAEGYPGTLTNTDDIAYPVLVGLTDKGQSDLTTKLGQTLLWRQKLRKAFISQALAGVSSVYICKPLPMTIIDVGILKQNRIYSPQAFQFISREARGLS